MKKILLLIVFYSSIVHFAYSQNIVAAEYFIDTDPGKGNGTALDVGTNGSTVNFTTNIPISTLSAGFHFLAIRTKDEVGLWGLYESRGFFVSSITANASNITAAEYFVDNDPGIGNGNEISVASSSAVVNIGTTFSTASLSAGFHFIAIRTKDTEGRWGLFDTRGFYISSQNNNVTDIIQAEYFYDTDPGVGNGIPIAIPTATSIYTDSLLLPLGTLPLGNHRIGIRVKNASGNWSLLENKLFNVCTRYGPLSITKFQIENNQVFFENLSTDNNTTLWKFGDATTDTVLNPIKIYNAAGNYNLQLISKNVCANDTLNVLININGIHRINANKAGNNGVATVVFDGNGFTSSTVVKLERSGTILLPEDKQFISSQRIVAYFNLIGKDTGRYNVIADLGGGPLDTLKNGFVVNTSQQPLVSMVVGGRNPARTGLMTRMMSLQNRGNEDAIMLPFASIVGYKPGTISIASLESFVDLSNQGIFQQTLNYLSNNNISADVLNAVDVDTTRKKQLLAYYRVKVPAESFVTNYYRIFNSFGLLSYDNSSLVYPPLFKSTLVLNDIASANSRDCMNSFLKKAVKSNVTVSIQDSAWNICFNNAFDSLARSVRDIVRDISQQNKSIPMKSMFATLLVQMSQCGASGMPTTLTSTQFDKIIKDVTYNWLYLENIDSIGRPCIDTTETLVFKQNPRKQKLLDEMNVQSQRVESEDCPGAEFFPELAELCEPFREVCGKVSELGEADKKIFVLFGKKILEKVLEPFDKACQVNSASAFCEELCEQNSVDPNVKFGPGDNNTRKHVNFLNNYGYTIFFENLPSATAPAAYVEITDTLDLTKLDINTFQTKAFGWGDSVVFADANRGDYSFLKSLEPLRPNKLRVDVRIDTITGIVKWKFFTLNPITLQLTDDPTEGFLPPNLNNTEGVGYVRFSINAKAGVTTGTVINNKASIVFDQNQPIITDVWQHIVDTTKPQSAVAVLPAVINTPNFVVNWAGSDGNAGIEQYAVYVSVNDSLYKQWKKYTTAVSDTFFGALNKNYKFFSIAVDRAGNFEEPPLNPYINPDAVTTIQSALPISLLSFEARKDGNKASLLWVTSYEQNAAYFEIHRSADGILFYKIGVVAVQNLTTGSRYNWEDQLPLNGVNYYRLKMVDKDSTSKLSPLRILRFGDVGTVLVFPTVTSSLVFIQSPKEVKAQLISTLGIVLEQKIVKGNSFFEVSNLPAGMYFVRIEGESKVFKIIKE